jgi:hypothetical protein
VNVINIRYSPKYVPKVLTTTKKYAFPDVAKTTGIPFPFEGEVVGCKPFLPFAEGFRVWPAEVSGRTIIG